MVHNILPPTKHHATPRKASNTSLSDANHGRSYGERRLPFFEVCRGLRKALISPPPGLSIVIAPPFSPLSSYYRLSLRPICIRLDVTANWH
jgi:hypothetical protein